MSCRHEPGETWYTLIRAAMVEEPTRTALGPAQTQALLERLEKEKIFSKA